MKNLNLRINAAGEIHISANPAVPPETADVFVSSNAQAILAALQKFAEAAKEIPKHKLYENGEIFYFLGKKAAPVSGIHFYLSLKSALRRAFAECLSHCIPVRYARI